MPLLRRLLWPWFLVPLTVSAGVLAVANHAGGIRLIHVWAVLFGTGFFGAIYAFLVGRYRQWSIPPKMPVEGAQVPAEPVALVSRGGYLTPAAGLFTADRFLLFVSGRLVVTLPFEQVGTVRAFRGRFLKTPYLEFLAKDGRSLGKVAAESAAAWGEQIQGLLGRPDANSTMVR